MTASRSVDGQKGHASNVTESTARSDLLEAAAEEAIAACGGNAAMP
jgi:hypothetical protein